MRTQVNVTVVVPLFNEVENVRPLHQALQEALTLLGRSYELIFVDDGSRDGTLSSLLDLRRNDPAVRVIQFRRNFGQTAAMRAGIQAARGAIIVTLDGDLQNDPGDIASLVAEIDVGNDLVIGWRRARKDPLFSRTFPSRIANRLIGWMTGVKVHDSGCSLKAYRGDMIKRVPLYSEMHRFIPAMSTLQAARISEVIVRHHPRRRGRSKYGLSRVGKVLLDVFAIKMLIAFRHRPLQWFSTLAIPFFCCAAIAGNAYLLLRFGGGNPAGLVSPTAFLLFSYLTVHFLFVGLLAEIIVRSGKRKSAPPKATIEHVSTSP